MLTSKRPSSAQHESPNGALQPSFFPGRMATQRPLALSARAWPVISPPQKAPSCFPQWLLSSSLVDTLPWLLWALRPPSPALRSHLQLPLPPDSWALLRAESSQWEHL